MDQRQKRVDTHKVSTKTDVRGHSENDKVSKIQTLIEVMRCDFGRPGKASNTPSKVKEWEPTKKWTPLYYAVYHNREAALLHFLRAGQSPDGVAGSELPPLCLATIVGHVSIVEILCDAGANVNATAKLHGETALHLAMKNGRSEIVDKLLSRNPDVDAKTKDTSATSLHYAAASSVSLSVVVALLKHGADYEALNAQGCSPAEVALQSHNIRTAVAITSAARGRRQLVKEKEMLLNHVENAQNRSSLNNELITDIFEAGCPPDSTVLIEAIKRNDPSLVEMFLEKGADPNRATVSGLLPIFAGLACSSAQIVHALILHKADVALRNSHGLTVLQVALESPLADDKEAISSLAEVLMSSGADPLVRREDRSTLLHIAVRHKPGLAKVTQLTLQYGVNVNDQDSLGNTALHIAYHSRSCTAVLLKHDADVNIVNTKGLTPLLHATKHATREKEPDLEQLIKSSNLRKVDSTGRTALHLAARNGLEKTVRFLIQAGADTTSVDSKKRTALLLSVLHHQWHIIPLLAVQPGISAWDEAGLTALHHIAVSTPKAPSSWKDIASAVAPFCEKGVSRSMRDKSGATPLIQAVKSLPQEGLPVVEVLLWGKGKIKGADKSNCVGHEDLQVKDALFYAATLAKPAFVTVLLQCGAPFTLKDWRPSKGRVQPDSDVGRQILKIMADYEWLRRVTALQRQTIGATSESILPKLVPVRDLHQLLTMGLDPNALPKSKGNSPLLWIFLNQISARHNQFPQELHEAIKRILSFGANPNVISTRNPRRTSQMKSSQQPAGLSIHPLTFLIEQCPGVDINLISLFLANGASLSTPSTFYEGRFPFHSAVSVNRLDLVEAFLTHKPKFDLNIVDARNRSPLLLAAEKGLLEIVKLLTRSGAKLDVKDLEGNTALHSAAVIGNKKVVAFLLRAGAKACKMNSNGKTPRDLISENIAEKDEITGLLKYAEEQEQRKSNRRASASPQPFPVPKENEQKQRVGHASTNAHIDTTPSQTQTKVATKPPPIHITKPSVDLDPSLATPVRFSKQMVSIRYMPPSPKRQSSFPSPKRSTASPSPGMTTIRPKSQSQSQSQSPIHSATNLGQTSTDEKPLPVLTRGKTTFDGKDTRVRESQGEELSHWLAMSKMMDKL